jgi:hypothetical protein
MRNILRKDLWHPLQSEEDEVEEKAVQDEKLRRIHQIIMMLKWLPAGSLKDDLLPSSSEKPSHNYIPKKFYLITASSK